MVTVVWYACVTDTERLEKYWVYFWLMLALFCAVLMWLLDVERAKEVRRNLDVTGSLTCERAR